jgi:hypothetical protein
MSWSEERNDSLREVLPSIVTLVFTLAGKWRFNHNQASLFEKMHSPGGVPRAGSLAPMGANKEFLQVQPAQGPIVLLRALCSILGPKLPPPIMMEVARKRPDFPAKRVHRGT